MAIPDTYRTIRSASSGIYREKGSRFLSAAFPLQGEPEVKSILEDVRKEHHDARHHCYAYLAGTEHETWRANDDGEPSGTAGRPILGQIRSFGLTNVLVVVSRYFGGTLLGVSGLLNAYKTSAFEALNNAEIIDHIIMETYEIHYPYDAMNDVMRIIKDEGILQSDHSFDTQCRIRISFRLSMKEKVLTRLSRVEGLTSTFLSVI